MKGLFLKIFLWFWITSTLTGVSLVLALVLQHQAIHSNQHHGLSDTVRYFGTAAVGVMDESGSDAASRYITNLSHDAQVQACLFDAHGKPVAGEKCAEFQPLASHIVNGEPSEFSVKDNLARVAVPIQRPGKPEYIFASELLVGPHAFLQLDFATVVIRGGLALIISTFVCYFLARYLTSPILRLRGVAQEITAGHLSVRVHQDLANRRDEVGDLVRDFNRMADTAEQLISSQRQLLYDVSHELRSPLARMNVAIDLLRDRVKSDPALDRIEVDIQRLNEMISRLLMMTKLEAAPRVSYSETVLLHDLVESVADDADFEAQENGSRVTVFQSCGVSLAGDYNLLRSALENVVRNAVRYTEASTHVEIRLQQEGGEAIISVRDHGEGIPESELGNIFEPFYRVSDSESRDTSGVGLGLSITERIVRLHGGRIGATNAKSGGLLVTIHLPVS
jgi:two-component system sensor histidine kinase CpxA